MATPTVPLTKPGAIATGAIIKSAGSDIGTAAAAGDRWVIKTERLRFRVWSPVIETTGDGDVGPVFENNRRLYGQFSLTGFMVAGQTVGLINLKDQESTALPTIGFVFGAAEDWPGDGTYDANFVMEDIQVDLQARGNVVGLAMRGRITNTDISAAGNDIT